MYNENFTENKVQILKELLLYMNFIICKFKVSIFICICKLQGSPQIFNTIINLSLYYNATHCCSSHPVHQ